MHSAAGILYLLLALVPTASALTCTLCSQEGPPPCTASSYSEECPAGTVCSSLVTSKSSGDVNSTNLVGGCVPDPMCNKTVAYQYTTYKFIQVFSCCSTNGCSPPVLPLPDTNTQPNGLWCPTCTSTVSPNCSTGETLLCTGSETYCYLQSVEAASIKGCATESYCQATNYSSLRYDTLANMYENIFCVKANPISGGTTSGTTIYTSLDAGTTSGTTIYTSLDAGTTSGTTGHTNVDAGNAHENNECGNAGSSLKCPGYHSIFLGVAGVVLGMLKISF